MALPCSTRRTTCPLALTAVQGPRTYIYFEHFWNDWSYRRDKTKSVKEADRKLYTAGLCHSRARMRAGFAYFSDFDTRDNPPELRPAVASTKLTMPVLTIGAEHATKDAPLLTMQGRALDLRGAMVADSGHFVMEENPDDFLAHLLPFLEGAPA